MCSSPSFLSSTDSLLATLGGPKKDLERSSGGKAVTRKEDCHEPLPLSVRILTSNGVQVQANVLASCRVAHWGRCPKHMKLPVQIHWGVALWALSGERWCFAAGRLCVCRGLVSRCQVVLFLYLLLYCSVGLMALYISACRRGARRTVPLFGRWSLCMGGSPPVHYENSVASSNHLNQTSEPSYESMCC